MYLVRFLASYPFFLLSTYLAIQLFIQLPCLSIYLVYQLIITGRQVYNTKDFYTPHFLNLSTPLYLFTNFVFSISRFPSTLFLSLISLFTYSYMLFVFLSNLVRLVLVSLSYFSFFNSNVFSFYFNIQYFSNHFFD